MIILYGSNASGVKNYFKKLFESYRGLAKEFKNEKDLIFFEEKFLKKERVKPLILTGTSLGSNTIDKKGILFAKKWNLKCFSIIEHWSWYKKRFESNNQIILPQKILVNDKKAKDDAISDGLPSEKLVILGNPVLEDHLTRSSNQRHKNKEELRRNYNLEEDKIIICFISESLTEFRKDNDELGFDEFEVFDELKKYFHDQKYHILVKSHPEDCKNKFGKPNQKISYIDKIPIEELAALSHKIIGMGSMLLIELSFYRNDIISYWPNTLKPFIGNLYNITVPVIDLHSLDLSINSNATGLEEFRSNYFGSTKRIINFLMQSSL